MKKTRIAIFGSCVSREIFNCDENEYFEICQYFNFTSMFSQMSFSTIKRLDEDELGHESRWYSKMIAADFNKDALEQIEKEAPEYIILDLMSERLMLGEFIDEFGEKTIMTIHDNIKKCKHLFEENSRDFLNNKFIDASTFEPNYITNIIKKFAKKLLTVCPADRVIFCESFFVNQYIDKEGRLKNFDSLIEKRSFEVNSWLEKIEKILLYHLEGCNVIHFPKKTMGDELHHLHLAPMHYCKNFYRYAYGKIKTIVGLGNFSTTDMIEIDNEEMLSLLHRRD